MTQGTPSARVQTLMQDCLNLDENQRSDRGYGGSRNHVALPPWLWRCVGIRDARMRFLEGCSYVNAQRGGPYCVNCGLLNPQNAMVTGPVPNLRNPPSSRIYLGKRFVLLRCSAAPTDAAHSAYECPPAASPWLGALGKSIAIARALRGRVQR